MKKHIKILDYISLTLSIFMVGFTASHGDIETSIFWGIISLLNIRLLLNN